MKKILILAAVAILAIGFSGCSNKKSKADKVKECSEELSVIKKRLNSGDKSAVKDIVDWEAKCKSIVKKPSAIKEGNLTPNPSNDKNF